eukprot:915604_1
MTQSKMSTFTWKIDSSLMLSMKNAMTTSEWKSPAFSIGGFRWHLNVYPNGKNSNSNGYVSLYLNLAFLPPKVQSLSIRQELCLIETDAMRSLEHTYHKGSMMWGNSKTLETESLQHLTTLTFTAKIDVDGVLDHEDNDITNQYISVNNESSKHSSLQSAKRSDQTLIETRWDSLTTNAEKLLQRFEQRLTDVEQRIVITLDDLLQIHPRSANSANTNNGRKRKVEQVNDDNSNEPPKKKHKLASNVKDKSKMSAKEVADWMGALGPAYKQYMDRCIDDAIDGCLMNELDEQSLTEIVTNKIH